MTTVALDLTPPSVTIKFSKGCTLNPVFYYLAPDNTPVDLTGYTARMQARPSPTSDVLIWDLSIGSGLSITIGTTTVGNVTIANCQGIKLDLTPEQTAAFSYSRAVFAIELTAPSGEVMPFIEGVLTPNVDIIR